MCGSPGWSSRTPRAIWSGSSSASEPSDQAEREPPLAGPMPLLVSGFDDGPIPGAEEEIQGEPFVGPAGQLLTKMILGMGLKREQVYIGNKRRDYVALAKRG